MARFDPKSYAKNVLRSAGYITAQSIKGVNPTITSYITETASSAREMYDFAKDFRRRSKEKIDENGNVFLKEFNTQKKNILDDIRTGKFYNPEREKAALDEYMKKEGFSFDDLDFDVDEDFGEDTESSSAESKAINSLSITQQKLTAASTDEIVRSYKANTRLSIKSSNRMLGLVNTSLSVINTSILNLHQDIATPLNTHIINSGNFYQAATSELAMQTKYLENINKILIERYETRKAGFGNKSSYKATAWEDIFSGGLPNLKKWGQYAKTNFMNSSSLGFMTDLLSPDMLAMISESGGLSSPIALIASMAITDRLQNSKFGKSLNRTENIFKGGFAKLVGNIAARNNINRRSITYDKYGKARGGTLLNSILSAFDIAPKANKKIDISKYHRGPLDWDGESKKALTEVIPQQLAMIISQLGGIPKVFNYKTGRWETPKNMTKNFREGRSKSIANENASFRDTITREFIDNYNSKLSAGQAEMSYRSKGTLDLSRDFDKVMEYFTINNIDSSNTDIDRELLLLVRKKIITKKSGEELRKAFKKHAGQLNSSVYSSKIAHNKFMADAGTQYSAIFNGSGLLKVENNKNKKGAYSNSILALQDDKGHDIYWYLQSFYSSFKYLEDSISSQNFSGNRGYKARRKYNVPLSKELKELRRRENQAIKNKIYNENTAKDDTYVLEKDGTYRESPYKSTNKLDERREENEKSSIFTKGVDKINDFLSKVFFGNGISQAKEFFANGGLVKLFKDLPGTIAQAIEDIKDKAKNWALDKWEKFKSSDFGRSYFGSMKDQVSGIGKSIWGHAKKSAGSVVDWVTGNYSGSAANGGMVTKSGMISVSEGEMIIPSEKNPFYKGRTNKSSQRAQEAMNYRRWVAQGGNKNRYWGSYADGIDFVRDLYSKAVSEEDIREQFKKRFGNYPSEKTWKKGVNQAKKIMSKATDTVKAKGSGVIDKGKKVVNELMQTDYGQKMKDMMSKADQAMSDYFGDKYTGTKDVAKSAMDVIKKSLPQTISSGTIGAIIAGAMTGSGLGLLGGFAIGAGVHVLKNSDDISKKLFGEERTNSDGTKTMSGGLIPAKAATFIKKRVPSIAKSGALGTALGLMGLAPGGILGGFMLGAGVDMLAHNETVKEYISGALFGNKGADGKRRGGIIGSLKVRVVDPLADYVKNGIGKVGEFLKNTVGKNVKELFVPLTDWVKGKGTRLLEGVTEGAKNIIVRIGRNIGELFNKTFGRLLSLLGFSGDKLLKFGKGLISIPFNAMGRAGEALNKHNIRMGYSTASAAERVKAMGSDATSYDKSLAELEKDNSEEGIRKRNDFIQKIRFYSNNENGARKALRSQREDLADTMVATLDNGGASNPKVVNALRKAIKDSTTYTRNNNKPFGPKKEHTDYSKLIKAIENGEYGITGERATSAINLLKEKQAEFNERSVQLDNWDAVRESEFSKDEYKGYDIRGLNGKLSDKKLLKLMHQTDNDYRRININDRKNWLKEENKNIAETIKDAEKTDPLGAKRNSILNTILDTVKSIAQHNGIELPEKNSFDKAKENTNIPSNENKSNENAGPKEGDKRQNPTTGKNEEYRGGKWVSDLSDKETNDKENEEKKEKNLRTRFYNFFLGGGLLTGLGKIFGINKEEKKETIFDKLKKGALGFLSTAGNFIGNLLSPITNGISSLIGMLTGSGITGLIKAGFEGLVSSGALSTILAGAGITWGLSKIHDKVEGSDKDSRVRNDIDPNTLKKSKDMSFFERAYYGAKDTQNIITRKNMNAYSSKDFVSDYAIDRGIKTTGINLLSGMAFGGSIGKAGAKIVSNTIGKVPVIGKALSSPIGLASKIGSKLPEGTNIFKNAASKIWNNEKVMSKLADSGKLGEKLYDTIGQVADDGLISTISDKIKNIFNWVFNKLGVKQAGSAADEAAEATAQAIVSKGGSANLGKLLSSIGSVIYIGRIILALEDGFEKAKAKVILGITADPTITQRLLAAALNGINYAIPGIGGLIPTEVLFNILYWIFEKFGISLGGLQEQREAAKVTLEEYKKATNNPGATLEEYVHNVLGEYTTQEKVKKSIGGAISKVKETASNGFNTVKTTLGKGITGIKNFGSKASTRIKNFGTNIASGAKNLVKTAGEKLSKGKDYIKEAVTGITTLAGKMEKVFVNKEAKMSDVIAVKPNIKEDNPLYGITNTIANGTKAAIIPGLFAKYIGIKVKNKAEEIFNNIKNKVEEFGIKIKNAVTPYIEMGRTIISDTTTTVGSNIDSFKSGDIVGLWTNKSTVSEDNPFGFISTIANMATSYGLTVPTLVSFVGHKTVEGIKSIGEFVSKEANNIASIGEAKKIYMQNGDFGGLWASDNKNAGGEGEGFISKLADTGFKFAYSIPTGINAIGKSINNIFTKTKNSIPNMGDIIDKLWKQYSDTNNSMDTYSSTVDSFKTTGDNVFGSLNSAMVSATGGIMRLLLTIIRPLKIVGDKVGGVVGGFVEGADNIFTSIKNWALNDNTSNTQHNAETGSGSGIHVSQKGSSRRFGSSTIGDNGCGPATAATVLRAYGKGGNLEDAARYAELGGYVAGRSDAVGTRASYFSDILGANGIRTSYTNSKNSIRGAIGSGNPTILLGQDKSNRSKINSPFGPNPHYVVARGSDSKGHVLIDDPELRAPAIYNKNILNKAKLGVLTGGGSNAIQADDGAVWNYLKSAGFTDAGVAGLMGNLYAESGLKSNKVEASSIKKSNIQSHDYNRDYGFTYDSDSYTAAVDKGLKQGLKGSAEQNLKPTFGVIPEYEFVRMPWKTSRQKSDGTYFGQNGYGLVQWTSFGRKQGLYDLVKKKGVSISDKQTQLEYLLYELQNKYPGVYNTLKTTTSLSEASNKVLTDFEAPDNAMSHSSTRASYGQTYYDKFTKEPPKDTSFGASTALGESGGGQTISFPTYNLTDSQLKGVANIIQHEQGKVQARYAEASLMANLIDMKDDSRATAQNLVAYLTKPKGWFADGKNRYEQGAAGSVKIEDTALAAATDIFNNGKRTMPRYINEHDCFSDISSTNPSIDKKNRSAYVPNQTQITNKYGSKWTFYSFPDDRSDPFGYTSEEMRSKHGDAHYDISADGTVTAPAGYSTGTSSSSGTSNGNASGNSSKPTNLAGILSSAFSSVFGAIGSKLTGKAGSIFKLLIGGLNLGGTSSNSTSSDGSTVTSGESANSTIQTSMSGDNTPQYGGKAKPAPQGKGTPQSMVQIAQSQLGVVEGPEGSNNGNITDYGKFMGMDGQPWCASFVSWVMDKTFNGDKTARNKALRGSPSAAVSGLWDNFKRAGAMTNDPQPGDIVIFKNGSSHTGLVETVNGKQISTLEGNTGSSNEFNRNGGVVARHQWTLGDGSSMDKKLTGFGRPDWSTTIASGSGLQLYNYIGGKAAAGSAGEYDYDDRDDGHHKPYPIGHGTPNSMVQIARSQLGVLEGGSGEKDESGKLIPHSGNITDYGKFMGMDKQPWCASFVSWVMDKTFNGSKNKRNYALRGNPSAAVSDLWNNFKSAGEMHDTPEPGDIAIYKNGTSHTGIVETVNGKHITTIEGNTSSGNTFERNGGIVFRKEFTIGDGSSMANKLTGFGRPNWNAEKEFGTGSGLYYNFTGGKAGTSSSKYGNHYLDSWDDEQRAINETINRNKAAASWEADNEAIRKMQNDNYYIKNAAKIWDDEQRAINETINRNKAAASWEADNEAIRKMQNDNYAKANKSSSGTTNSGSSYSSGGTYNSNSGGYVAGGIDTASLNSILEYLKTIADNSKYEATLPTIVDLISKLAGITATVNSNSTTITNQDQVNNINADISSIIQKLESISSTL